MSHFQRSASTTQVLLFHLVAASCALTLARGAVGVEFVKRIPADACWAISSPNVGLTCQRFQDTLLGQNFCGSHFAALRKDLDRKNWTSPFYLRSSFGFDWKQLLDVRDPGGMVIFPLEDGSMGAVWLFMPPAETSSRDSWRVEGEQFFQRRGFLRIDERRNDVQLTYFRPPTWWKGKASTRTYFAAPDFRGAANSKAAAEAILQVRPENSLAAQDVYQKSDVSPADDPAGLGDASLFVRPMPLWTVLEQSNRQAAAEENSALQRARRQGMEAVRSIVGDVDFEPTPPSDIEIEGQVVAQRPYGGALRMLELRSGPVPALPPWVGAGFHSVFIWRWDFSAAIKGFGTVFDEANWPGPEGEGLFEETMDALRDDPEMRLDMRSDLFGNLGPVMLRVADKVQPDDSEQPDELARRLFVTSMQNRPTVLDAFRRFYKNDKDVRYQQLNDYELWTVAEGRSLFVEGESDSVITIRAVAVGEAQVLFSTDIDLLKIALLGNEDAATIHDDQPSALLLNWIGSHEDSQTALRGVMRLDQTLADSYRAATQQRTESSDGMMTQLWMHLLYGTANRSAHPPYKSAPAYDQVRGALSLAAIIMSQKDEDWAIKFCTTDTADAAAEPVSVQLNVKPET